MLHRRILGQPIIVQMIWAVLLVAFVLALAEGRWSLAFVSAATFGLSILPVVASRRFGIRLPVRFFAWIVVFVFGTIFLGEAFDFYTRYWWWDVILHAGSAVGFGLAGFLFVFMLFEGDRYAAPAWAVAFISFCFALSIGTLWEIFEFAMDQIFGLNMQKSGLIDTMWDLIVDTLGASIGAIAGLSYLKGQELGGLTAAIREFVAANRRFFRKRR
ncbi:MAG: hypothetical protein KDE06_03650 [Rhodobacteraceae bacterium]|uniref:hypothetical protein n=1 Tax=Albidovulum sp. TaxID=1872424 RepID=UPI001D22D444|nr:hypothetical protein [Paracoccaceae bacterium]MCC0046810.1 hypothetical protein [Defluviimonas sp.]HPE25464.1 hypothetical protein [Albidovulum sp.]MCB2132996.1 hypothetical protein [Paracoccaceae bacterium]MCB2144005.1 hypothetical protein [Paracoccaceae bacterium]